MKIDLERLRPNRPEDTDIQLIDVGDGRYTALVVDNFYRDPGHMREFALSLHYRSPPAIYPGYWAVMSLSVESIVSFLFDQFAHLYFPSAASMEEHACSWQFFNTERRAGDPPRPSANRPHVDTGLLVGLVYLNKPEHCRGGTSFFRHNETGAEAIFPPDVFEGRGPNRAPIDVALKDRMWHRGAQHGYERARAAGFADSYDGYWRRILDTPGDENGNIVESCGGWELTRVVEMKYNRLVLFPGFIMHSTHFRPEWFDNTPETWRLTHNLMFNWPAQARS